MLLFLLDAKEAIADFYKAGGPVLNLIAALTFIMWLLMLERFAYYTHTFKPELRRLSAQWDARSDMTSWFAEAIRRRYTAEARWKVDHNLKLIKVLIALCPLFGLLGTVTGMIDVFTVLSVTGGGDAKSMAGGVSRATIPTMAGMVAALSGVFGNIYLTQLATRRRELIEEYLPRHHHTDIESHA